MLRGLVITGLLGLAATLGCSGRTDRPETPTKAQTAAPQASRKDTAARRLNYVLPEDIPKLADCRLRLELLHFAGQQIVWETGRSAADIYQTLIRELKKSSWVLAENRKIEGGFALVGRKSERKCSYIIGNADGGPTRVILLLSFEESQPLSQD